MVGVGVLDDRVRDRRAPCLALRLLILLETLRLLLAERLQLGLRLLAIGVRLAPLDLGQLRLGRRSALLVDIALLGRPFEVGVLRSGSFPPSEGL